MFHLHKHIKLKIKTTVKIAKSIKNEDILMAIRMIKIITTTVIVAVTIAIITAVSCRFGHIYPRNL